MYHVVCTANGKNFASIHTSFCEEMSVEEQFKHLKIRVVSPKSVFQVHISGWASPKALGKPSV